MCRRLSSRTSRDSDAHEEDYALGRTRISGIDRGWSRLMDANYIVIKLIDIYKSGCWEGQGRGRG